MARLGRKRSNGSSVPDDEVMEYAELSSCSREELAETFNLSD
jgi:hypothetical protein